MVFFVATGHLTTILRAIHRNKRDWLNVMTDNLSSPIPQPSATQKAALTVWKGLKSAMTGLTAEALLNVIHDYE